MKSKIRIIVPIFIICLLVTYFGSGILYCPHSTTSIKTDPYLPQYISYLWPFPESKISLRCFIKSFFAISVLRGISVGIETPFIKDLEAHPFSGEEIRPFEDRVHLYLNGTKVSNSTKSVFENLVELIVIDNGKDYKSGLSTEYIVSWTPFLAPGNYNAKLEIVTKSGEILNYDWQFTIGY